MKKYIIYIVILALVAITVLIIKTPAVQEKNEPVAEFNGAVEPSDPDYTGVYEYNEFAPSGGVGSNQTWAYQLKIYQESPAQLKADFNVDGFQTITRISALVRPGSQYMDVVFDSYRPENMYTPFTQGDILFSLKPTAQGNFEIIWGKMKSNLVAPGYAEFKKK